MKDLNFLPNHILSPGQAHLEALALTLSYVGSLYLTKPGTTRRQSRTSSPERTDESAALGDIISQDEYAEQMLGGSGQFEEQLHRDHPVVIKSRIRAVSAATVVGCVGVGAVVGRFLNGSGQLWTYKSVVSLFLLRAFDLPLTRWHSQINATSTLLGFTPPSASSIISRQFLLALILPPLLFIGPLYTTYLDKALPFQQFGKASLGLGSSTRNDGMLDCLRVFWTRAGDEKELVQRMNSRNLQQRRWIELRNCVAVSTHTFSRSLTQRRRTENPTLCGCRDLYPKRLYSDHALSQSTNSLDSPRRLSYSSPRCGLASVSRSAVLYSRYANLALTKSVDIT
jgi:hypothetical protein